MNDENYGTIISNEVITQSQDTSSDIAHINSDTTNLFNYTTTGYLLDNSGAIEAPVQLGYSLINSQPHLVYTMYFQQNGMSNSNLKYPVYTINSVQQELSRSDLSADIPQMLNIKQDTAFQLEGNPAIAPLQLIADHAATTFQYREFPSPLNCTAKEAFMQEQSFDLGTFCELQGFSQNQQIIQQQNETSTINPCEISAVDKENNNNSSEDASDVSTTIIADTVYIL